MSIYKMGKIVLALLLAGSLSGCLDGTGVAWAEGTRIIINSGETYTDNGGVISGTFSGVSGEGTDPVQYGGAIYNAGTINSITGTLTTDVNGEVTGSSTSFTGNKTTETSTQQADDEGGAIYNCGTITSISGVYFGENQSTRGGAIYNIVAKNGDTRETNTGIIGTISGSYFVENVAGLYGGAIYNGEGATISSITGSYFLNNEADGGNGGAIENAWGSSTIGDITYSYFEGNTAKNGNGGAIYNEGQIGTVLKGEGDDGKDVMVDDGKGISYSAFIDNTAEKAGGAIYNSYNKDEDTYGNISSIAYSYFKGNKTEDGGAIYNGLACTIGKISDCYFEKNSSTEYGGAIFNNSAFIPTISNVKFISNSVECEKKGGAAEGGAIYNDGNITSITNSLFSNNSVTNTDEDGRGGAIANKNGMITMISDCVFTSNSANGYGGAISNVDQYIDLIKDSKFTSNTATYGGAIDISEGLIGEINNCSFYNNVASECGGAIYIDCGNIGTNSAHEPADAIINCSFTENHATSTVENKAAYGGAIYLGRENSTIDSITNTSFIGNYATSESDEAKGGAIYATSDLTIVADSGETIFSGNYTQGSDGVKDDNAIYMAKDADGNVGNITFTLSNKGTITLEDNIRAEEDEEYSVKISGDGTDTTFYLLNDIYDGDVSIGNTTLSTIDGEVHSYYDVYGDGTTGNYYGMKTFTLTDNINMVADVDLVNQEMDRIVTIDKDAEGYTNGYNVGNYTLTVTGMNLLNDAEEDKVAVYFAETDLMKNVSSGMTSLPDSNQLEAFTPLYEYDVYYVYKDDSGLHDESGGTHTLTDSTLISSSDDDGGYFVFHKSGLNPSVMAPAVAEAGAYNAFGMVFDYNFEHSDYYMKLPEDVRLAMNEERKQAKKAPKENDPTKTAYYNQHELTYHGAWTRSFFSNESVDYGAWSSRDKYYGAMVGFDTDMKVNENGWATVTTGYAGTLGIRQQYSGGHIKQHGGFIGVTESFYKKNFYNAWTIAAGTTKAHEHTMYGKDKDRIDQYGIATRLGWNIKLDDEGKYTLLPTFTASYTYVHPEDFTNAGGVHIAGSGFRAVQLNPNVKFVMNLENGWQPYLTVGEVWTVGESTHLRANGIKLDELDLDPYTEYGIGVQKRWANEKDAYIQFLGHSHGRDGFLVNAGIRWNF